MDFSRPVTVVSKLEPNSTSSSKAAEDSTNQFPLYQVDILQKQKNTKHLNLSTNLNYDYKPMKYFDTKVVLAQKDFHFFRFKLTFGARVICYVVDQEMKRISDDLKLWNQWYHLPHRQGLSLWVRIDEEIRPGYYETVGWGIQPLLEGTFNCKIYPGSGASVDDLTQSLKKNTAVRKEIGILALDVVKVKRNFNEEDKPVEDSALFAKSLEVFEFLDDSIIRNAHDAYLTINQVNLKKINSSSSARNIICRVHVLEKCDPQAYTKNALDCFETGYKLHDGTMEMSNVFETNVTYHEKNPKFADCCHIKLPRRLTSHHHLRFSFFHISIKQSKKDENPTINVKRPMSVSVATIKTPEQDKRISINDFDDLPPCITPNREKDEKLTEIETFLGYSCIPLFGKGLINDGAYELPLATEFPPSGDYLSGKDGDLKFIDGGKPVFNFDARVYSTKTSKDLTVFKFLSGIESVIGIDRSAKNSEESLAPQNNRQPAEKVNQLLSEREIGNLIMEVEQLNENIIIVNHDKLLKSALKLLPLYPNLNNHLFHFILKIINIVYNKYPEYLTLFISKLRNPSDYSLCNVLCDSFHKFLQDDSSLKDVLANSVCIAQIINKLVKEELNSKNFSTKRFTNNGASIDDKQKISFLKLVKLISDQVINKTYNLLLVKELNSAFGDLMSVGISVLAKDQWFQLFQSHIEKLLKEGSPNSLSMLFDLIKCIGTHEHFFELNHPEKVFNYKDHGAKLVGVIKFGFEHHKLAFMLAAQLGDFVLHENSDVRSRAIHCMEYILQYSEEHHLPEFRNALLGYLFLPFTLKVLDNCDLLKTQYSTVEYRSLLTSFIYILRYTDLHLITFLLRVEAHEKMTLLLQVLLEVFTYPGQHKLMDQFMDYQQHEQQDAKSVIEQMYKNSAINRNRNSTNNSIKTRITSKTKGVDTKEYNNYTRKLACLQQEIGLLVLDYCNCAFAEIPGNKYPHLNNYLSELFTLLVIVCQGEHSRDVLDKSTEILLNFITTFSENIFQKRTRYCQDLCKIGFTFGWSLFPTIKECGNHLLYNLLKKNYDKSNQFAMTRIQMTVALSQLEPPPEFEFSESLTQLKKLNVQVTGNFTKEADQLINQLIQVCKDLAEMRQVTEKDPEIKGDLYLRLINGYKGTPDLRIAVLESLAQYHISRNFFQEAAVCYFHCSAIIGEFLTKTNPTAYKYENNKFLITCPSVNEETPICEQSAIDTDTVGQGPQFSERGLVKFLTEANHCMQKAQFFEIIHEGYKLLVPLYESQKNNASLAQLYRNMADCYDSLVKVEMTHGRVFDIFYRVGFYGKQFGNYNGIQYIYKERLVTQLAEICERMKLTYGTETSKIELIQDSGPIDLKKLKEDVGYIQITHVKPSKEGSQFDKNFKIDKFVFSTPFTKNGKAHGGVDQQYLRKYVVYTDKPFPYLVKRIKITKIEDYELTPLEVCIENLQERLVDMRLVLTRQPPDIKELQRVLSGSVRVQVNSGPLEIAKVFFGQRASLPADKIALLEKIFMEFMKLSEESLILNKKLVKNDQLEFQEDLEEGFAELKVKLLATIQAK